MKLLSCLVLKVKLLYINGILALKKKVCVLKRTCSPLCDRNYVIDTDLSVRVCIHVFEALLVDLKS